jgi:hypothetical protein
VSWLPSKVTQLEMVALNVVLGGLIPDPMLLIWPRDCGETRDVGGPALCLAPGRRLVHMFPFIFTMKTTSHQNHDPLETQRNPISFYH